ncbi:MAG: lysostaphin resistance A-like protein [Alistipes indistinctus]
MHYAACVIAAAVFGIVHLIPQQVINAFMVGLVLGYIYYRTGSLLPVILIHCINNAISYFSWMLGGGKILSTREQLGNETL